MMNKQGHAIIKLVKKQIATKTFDIPFKGGGYCARGAF
jgi:hypothetical protein